MLLAAAREWFERALSLAQGPRGRPDTRAIAARICDLMELQDFDECRRLDAPAVRIVSDECIECVDCITRSSG